MLKNCCAKTVQLTSLGVYLGCVSWIHLGWPWAVILLIQVVWKSSFEQHAPCFLLFHDGILSRVSEDEQECWPLLFFIWVSSSLAFQWVSNKNTGFLILAEFGELQAVEVLICHASCTVIAAEGVTSATRNKLEQCNQENKDTKMIAIVSLTFSSWDNTWVFSAIYHSLQWKLTIKGTIWTFRPSEQGLRSDLLSDREPRQIRRLWSKTNVNVWRR